MGAGPDIAGGRRAAAEYAEAFGELKPPLNHSSALVEASRCYFCYDAPCVEACPTGIDIPSFIRKIETGNVKGAALDILEPNIFGGACARVCPVETLCEQARVREAQEGKPVAIGLLQRHATDLFLETGEQPFARAASSGRRAAVIGAGPAGLSAAHRLSRLGHDVTVFEARDKPGGLNEYGIAAYKVPNDFAQREAAFILGLGGIEIEYGKALGKEISLTRLRQDFGAVFIGVGQAAVRALDAEGHGLAGIEPAVAYIARLRQADDVAALPVGRRIIVIGGGNTAVDIAVQTKRLGAEDVTIVYRRGPDAMSATGHEQDLAQTDGVRIRHWAQPKRFAGEAGRVSAVEFERTEPGAGGRAQGTGETYTLDADMVFTAIGQVLLADPLEDGAAESLTVEGGCIAVDGDMATSLPGVYAGGDCVAGQDLTVQAVEDGKRAALAMDKYLRS